MSDSTSSRRPLRILVIALAVVALVVALVAVLQFSGAVSLENIFSGFKALRVGL